MDRAAPEWAPGGEWRWRWRLSSPDHAPFPIRNNQLPSNTLPLSSSNFVTTVSSTSTLISQNIPPPNKDTSQRLTVSLAISLETPPTFVSIRVELGGVFQAF